MKDIEAIIDLLGITIMIPIVLIILSIIFIYFGIPYLHSKLTRISLKQRVKNQRALVITFDESPSSRLTSKLLSLLAENNAKATFFLLGHTIEGRESIVREIAEKGHDICSHGYDHLHYWKVSPLRAISDIRRGWEAINGALNTQRKTYPFRPPMGKLNILCLLYLIIRRVPIIYWSVDAGDTWQVKPESRRLSNLLEQTDGMVCLLHDFDRSNESTNLMVLDSVNSVLSTAEEKNMQVLTISELLKSNRQNGSKNKMRKNLIKIHTESHRTRHSANIPAARSAAKSR